MFIFSLHLLINLLLLYGKLTVSGWPDPAKPCEMGKGHANHAKTAVFLKYPAKSWDFMVSSEILSFILQCHEIRKLG